MKNILSVLFISIAFASCTNQSQTGDTMIYGPETTGQPGYTQFCLDNPESELCP